MSFQNFASVKYLESMDPGFPLKTCGNDIFIRGYCFPFSEIKNISIYLFIPFDIYSVNTH